jgi:hypothetical protein
MKLNPLLPLISAFLLTPTLNAGTLFSTGFEPPTYTLGALNGQNSWTNTTIPVVENTVVFAGSQAVAFDSTGVTGQNLAVQPLTYNSAADPDQIVVFDAEFMESPTGNDPTWDVFGVGGGAGFVAQLTVQNGKAQFGPDGQGIVGAVPVTAGVWNDYQLVLNFATGTASAYVDSIFIGSGAFDNPTTTLTSFNLGVNSLLNGTDTATGYYDNISVTTTAPEPGSVGFVLAGLALLAARSRLRVATEPPCVSMRVDAAFL